MSELKNHQTLWMRLLGDPLPPPDTFVYWVANFSDEVIRYSIQRAAAKNLKMNGTMPLRYREQYATSVMRVARKQKARA
jgi:hypothetical protein